MGDLTIRWALGPVSDTGWEAFQLSVWGAFRLFGPDARYVACVDTAKLELGEAQSRVGALPESLEWISGAPAGSLYPEYKELLLDHDCVLWRIPSSLKAWLRDSQPSVLVAQSMAPLARFGAALQRSSGMRGLPARFDHEGSLQTLLGLQPWELRLSLDALGVDDAALFCGRKLHVVSADDVAIASPFPPHTAGLGRCGARFVGLRAKSYPWSLGGRPAEAHIGEFWKRHLPEVRRRVGIEAQL
jgi:hypothetical protein